MYDLVAIGHISVDQFFRGDSFTFSEGRFQLAVGGKYTANYFHTSVGGGGANVAIGAVKNGLRATVLGKIGNNSSKATVLDYLQKNNIATDLCRFEDDFINISTILLTDQGERTIINYEPSHENLINTAEDLQKLEGTKVVYMGNLADISIAEREILLKQLKEKNVLTVLNLGVADCRRPTEEISKLIQHTDILILNGHEWADLVKKKFEEMNFNINVSVDLPILKEKLLVITDGKNGSWTYQRGHIYYQEAIQPEKHIDSTGCGDAYSAAFLTEYLSSKNIVAAMSKASTYAAKILSQVGAN